MTGVITSLKIDRGFGFLTPIGGTRSIFFHFRDLDHELDFDESLMERRVEFAVIETEKGPCAISVRAAN